LHRPFELTRLIVHHYSPLSGRWPSFCRWDRIHYLLSWSFFFTQVTQVKVSIVRCKCAPARVASDDCVPIATDHTSYDYEAIVRDAKLVVDTLNATRHVKENRDKVVHR
jgi:hypothetical protein